MLTLTLKQGWFLRVKIHNAVKVTTTNGSKSAIHMYIGLGRI